MTATSTSPNKKQVINTRQLIPTNIIMQTIQIPLYLGMQPLICFYCKASGLRHTCSGDLEGIISCERHAPQARRDCHAFLHQTEKALLRDAIEHPGLKPFFDALLLLPTFATVRSSGALDEGWSIPEHLKTGYGRICKSPAGDWAIPIEKQAESIGRGATFKSFLAAGVPGITEELVAAAIAALEAGLYRDAAEEQACMEAEAAAAGAVVGVRSETPIPADDGILEVMVNGRLCRVLDDDGAAAAAIAAGVVPRPLV